MKLSIKTIIIVFLVALLGSGLGTFGVMSLYNATIEKDVKKNQNSVVINEVEYTSIEKTDYTSAIEKAYNTVVEITCTVTNDYSNDFFFFGSGSSTSTSAGSGVIFSEDGYIVTNQHVIDGLSDESSLIVKVHTGEEFSAKVIGYDTRTDIAVIKINAHNLPYASFADSSKLVLGQDVLAIGNPLGLGISCSNGIVSALEKEIYINNVYMTVIQTNAAVNEGNSGGGLFDSNGNLIGIVNAKKMSSSTVSVEGMGYAIPSNTALRIVNDLIQNGYVKDRAVLGIKVQTTSSYYSSNGVVVAEVIEGGAADLVGIQQGDIILSLDDHEVNSFADLSKVLDTKAVGEIVNLKILRDEKELNVKLTLQAATND